MNHHRIFILGAGFSCLAGLPLAQSLWEEVIRRTRSIDWIVEELEYELSEYHRFRISRGDNTDSTPIDFEDFLAYLDLEHALGLKGSDHFSDEGNRLQLVLKWLIAQIIVERTPPPDRLPSCYIEFANALKPGDYVITFNYDNILETVLDLIEKPYRLFPSRYKEVDDMGGIVDSSHNEVVILKLHGSVDWFDRASYTRQEQRYKSHGINNSPDNLIFGPKSSVSTVPLLEGPQFNDDPLLSVHRVTAGLDEIYLHPPPILISPVLLAPSNMKVLYANRLKYSFWGLGQAGGLNLGIIVIGYSLPRHDDYARQLLMRIFANYQRVWWKEEVLGMNKKPVLLIDYRGSLESEAAYKLTYSFSEQKKTRYHLTGFDSNAVTLIRNVT